MKHKFSYLFILLMLMPIQSLFADDGSRQNDSFMQPVFEKTKLPERYAGIDYTIENNGRDSFTEFTANAAFSFNRSFGLELSVPYVIYVGCYNPDNYLGLVDAAFRGAFHPADNFAIGYGISLLYSYKNEGFYTEDYYAAPYLTAVWKYKIIQTGINGKYEQEIDNSFDDYQITYGGHLMVRVWRSLNVITELQGKVTEINDDTESNLDFAAGIRFDANHSEKFKVGIGIQAPVNHDDYDFRTNMNMSYLF
ncbi:MAG: hypothetical protein JW982_17015 [Spirochaetes bacterium]|nr:hypothetical protein [Spirochaetota bacterium]